jgi:hypothetical protein
MSKHRNGADDDLGHKFRDFKESERICWGCGFVIPRSIDAHWKNELRKWGKCSGKWHVRAGGGER